MKAAVKDHNARYCVPVTGKKADLKGRMVRVSERFETTERKVVVAVVVWVAVAPRRASARRPRS